MLLPIHIAAGGLAIVLGAVALIVKKGGPVHRHSGLLFVYAMLIMGLSASILTIMNGGAAEMWSPACIGVFRRHGSHLRPPGLVLDARDQRDCTGGRRRAHRLEPGERSGVHQHTRSRRDGVPFRTAGVMSLVVATVLAMAAAGDVRIMCAGMPRGAPRLARHLWRMCFALFIAAGSFLSLRERVAQILPEPFTTGPMRALPIVLLFGAMFYWLWRVRGRRPLPVLVRHDSVAVAPRAN